MEREKVIKKKKLLITGASGLLGKSLLSQIPLEVYEVIAVTRQPFKGILPNGIKNVCCDLLQQQERTRIMQQYQPEYMIHLAWEQTEGFRSLDTNILWLSASLELLHSFKVNGGKRFIFAGSSSEYDGENGQFDENSGFASTQYGICKRAFTQSLNQFGKAYGISVVSARYFTLYGKNERHIFGAIPSAICSFYKNEKVNCKAPNNIRDYVYVEDAAEATIKLLESDITGAINIASGEPKTMQQVFTQIAKMMNKEDLLIYSEQTTKPDILTADIGKLQNKLGYVCQTSFEEGLKRTIEWWGDNIEI